MAGKFGGPNHLSQKLFPATWRSRPAGVHSANNFYSIENDVLSPLCFGAAFICLVRLLRADVPDVRSGTLAGLMLAATYLAKISNLPLLVVSAVAVLCKIWRLAKAGKLRPSLPALALVVLSAGLPMSAWRVWTKYNFGDCTGSGLKMQLLGWSYKPFGEWWNHPIFTLHGFWTFISKLMATFWQGEFLWHCRPLASSGVDVIYLVFPSALSGWHWFAIVRRDLLSRLKSEASGALVWLLEFCRVGGVSRFSIHHL